MDEPRTAEVDEQPAQPAAAGERAVHEHTQEDHNVVGVYAGGASRLDPNADPAELAGTREAQLGGRAVEGAEVTGLQNAHETETEMARPGAGEAGVGTAHDMTGREAERADADAAQAAVGGDPTAGRDEPEPGNTAQDAEPGGDPGKPA